MGALFFLFGPIFAFPAQFQYIFIRIKFSFFSRLSLSRRHLPAFYMLLPSKAIHNLSLPNRIFFCRNNMEMEIKILFLYIYNLKPIWIDWMIFNLLIGYGYSPIYLITFHLSFRINFTPILHRIPPPAFLSFYLRSLYGFCTSISLIVSQ